MAARPLRKIAGQFGAGALGQGVAVAGRGVTSGSEAGVVFAMVGRAPSGGAGRRCDAGAPHALDRLGERERVLADRPCRAGAARVRGVAVPLPDGPVVPSAANGRADPVPIDLEWSYPTLGQIGASATLDVERKVLRIAPDGAECLLGERVDVQGWASWLVKCSATGATVARELNGG